jgi:RNA polymerase sigma-70 factor (ECF subfamily)
MKERFFPVIDATREKEIIRRVLLGETMLYAQLVDAYSGPLFNLAFRMTGNRNSAADAVQETFLRAYSKLGSYSDDRKFFTWIYAICINLLRDLRRQDTAAARQSNELALSDSNVSDSSSVEPVNELLRQERAESLVTAVRLLPELQREVVALRFFQDLSFAEIAEILGVSENAAKKRVYQALTLLRRALREERTAGA